MTTNETRERVRQAVERLVAAIMTLRTVKKAYKDLVLTPGPPASKRELLDYEQVLGAKLPPEYRAFLELHNGYSGLTVPGSMLPLESVLPEGAEHSRIEEWRKETVSFGSGQVADGIVIASMNGPNRWVFLDRKRPTENGELTVVSWEPDDSSEFPSLVAFLDDLHRYCGWSIERATKKT